MEAANTSIKESAALWVEEAKKELHRVADEVTAEAKKSFEAKEAGPGRGSWAEEMDEEMAQHQSIQGRAKAIPTYAQLQQALANEWRKDTEKQEKKVHHDYMAREGLQRRKILIDGIEGVQSAAGGLSPKEIVEKANLALAAAMTETDGNGAEPTKDPVAVAAKVLENGGVVVELESEEDADWVRSEGVRQAFEGNFGGSAKVKDQLFQVVASFLPVTLRDELEGAASRIEEDNGLPTDCVAQCRWLKAPKFWNKGQRFAHAIIGVKGRLEASLLIKQGVLFESQRFKVRKLIDEPKRCYKCQRVGHTATGCKEIHDICPNCAEAHAGKDCDRPPRDYRCINCLKAKLKLSHAVWDKECPSMLAEKKKKAERSPDSSYKYYPTKEEWTWERREGPGDNTGSVLAAGPRRATGIGGAARQGRGGVETADGGWEGMRAKRAQEEGARSEGIVRPTASRSNYKGKGRETGVAGPASQTPSNSIQTSLPSQENRTGEPRAASSRARQEMTSGRQSVLGDYWRAQDPAFEGTEESDIYPPQDDELWS